MHFAFLFFVAKRYLFSTQKQHAINLITRVSMIGVALGTMALIIVLSVLNGFESVVKESFNNFNPELCISPRTGKTFSVKSEKFVALSKLPHVTLLSEELQEMALLSYDERQFPVIVKGVDTHFNQLTRIDTLMMSGALSLDVSNLRSGIIGIGLAGKLDAGVNYNEPMFLYAPKREGKINVARPDQAFYKQPFFVSGVFAVQQPEFDEQMVIIPISLARQLFSYSDSMISALNLKIDQPENITLAKKEIIELLGDDFVVADQYEQQADFYRILQIEKWITFLILAFILFIATCNIIGSLSMLMIDKQVDISIFQSMGATDKQLQHLFLLEGWLISFFGAIGGLFLGIVICLLQKQFGIIKMGTGYIVQSYPVVLQPLDIFLVLITVLLLGFFAAYYPSRLINRHQKELNS